jgi:PKD repeat protein
MPFTDAQKVPSRGSAPASAGVTGEGRAGELSSTRNASIWAQRIGIGVVVALVAVLALRVGSSSSQSVTLRDLTVWLPSTSTGEVVLAHAGSGSRGEVVARVKAANPGEQMVVVQSDAGAVVLNRAQREVGLVDGITLTLSQKAPLADVDAGAQLLWSEKGARVVTAGTVYRLDPLSGIPNGSVTLSSPLSSAVADANGWVYGVNSAGQIVAVGDSATPVSLPDNAEPAGVVAASGHAYVVDRQSQTQGPTLHGLEGSRVTGRYCLSGTIPTDRSVVTGGSTAADEEIAVVVDGAGGVRISDLRRGTCTSVALNTTTIGSPVVSGGFVYLPVLSTGEVIVVNATEGTTVGRYNLGLGAGRAFDLVDNDGTVWFNDSAGTAAGVLGHDRVTVRVDKSAASAIAAVGSGNASGRTGSGSAGQGNTGSGVPSTGASGAIVSGATGRSGTGGNTGTEDPSGTPSTTPGTKTTTVSGAAPDPASPPSGTTARTGLVADFTYSARSVKIGQPVSFVDKSSGDPTAWTWEFGDGTFATGPSVSHSWEQAGVFTATLRVENATGSASASVAITVISEAAKAKPDADFRFNASRVEVGQAVVFTDRSAGEPTEWQWSFGDGSGGSGSTVSHVYRLPGSYEVTLTATNAEGSDTSSPAVITVFDKVDPPIAAIGGGLQNANVGQQVSYFSRSTGNPTVLQWSFGDGTTSSGAAVQHAWTKGGTYVVTLAVSNSAGTNSITSTIIVADTVLLPESRFTVSQNTAEEGQSLRFQSLSINGPTQLVWDFGDGAGASGASVTHTYNRAGTYTVSLRATNAAGNDIATQSITVVAQLPAPVAAFSFSPNTITTNTGVVFTDESSGGAPTSWSWDFGDGTAAVAQRNPTHMFERVGTYVVRLTVANAKGTSTAQRNVTVLPAAPEASFSFAPIAPLAGAAVQFNDTSTGGAGTSWLWNFGDGATSTARNPTHAFAANGSYDVRLTVTNASGSSPWTRRVDVSPLAPVAAFDFAPTAPTTAAPVVFHNTSTGGDASTIRWDFGDSTPTSSTPSPSHAYAAPGAYVVRLTMANVTGTSSATLTVTVTVPPPVVAFTASTPAVSGSAVAFTNTSTGGPFSAVSWDFGDGTAVSTAANPSHVFAAAGAYNVRLTVANGGGPASTTVRITVVAAINATFTVSAAPKAGSVITFTNTTTGGPFTSLTWTFGDGASGTGSPATHTFAAAGPYSVTLAVVASSGATSSRTTVVTVAPAVPSASFSYAPGSPARTVTFTNTSAAVGQPFDTVTWHFGDGTADVVSAGPVSHTFAGAATSFSVVLTIDNASGTDSATRAVSLLAPTAAFTFVLAVRTAAFTNASTGGPFNTVAWDFDDGTPVVTSTTPPPHTFATPGTYNVQLTVTTGQGTSSVTHAVIVVL